MRNFYSIYMNTEKKDLMKPNGLIPYTLHRDFGYNTTIATYDNNEDYNDDNIKGVNIDFIKKITGKPIIDGSLYIMKNAKKIDILHTFFWKKENYIWFFLYKLLNKHGKTYVTMDADERLKKESMKTKGLKGVIKTNILNKCNLISTETKEMHEWLKENWYKEIKYIPYGVLPPQQKINYDMKNNTIITVGRIGTYQKANEILLEAYKKIYKDIPNWNLKIIGPIQKKFEEYISRYYKENPDLESKVIFTGPIFERKKLMKEFEQAKIFCLTSRYESFGLVLSEAGSRGDYIVSTNIAPARDLTEGGKYGTLFEIDNIEELAKRLKEICDDDVKLKENCEEIQEFINTNYTWKVVCKKALNYLGEEIENEN